MEILNAYDLTRSLRDAGELAGFSHHAVKHYVERCAAGGEVDRAAADRRLSPEVRGVGRAQPREGSRRRGHEKLLALGYGGSGAHHPTSCREGEEGYRAGHVRVHLPWITEPGMWLKYDSGDGPVVDGVKTVLSVAWLAWSRFRVVLPHRRDRLGLPAPLARPVRVVVRLDQTDHVLRGIVASIVSRNCSRREGHRRLPYSISVTEGCSLSTPQ